ncbi:HU family DNA-binding protein [Neotabrizicola sp. VNH66]|uniref:HU family DNA-binding protein n=1 Tax=Neotabrizicola sp. VNH66 TaxID=3400918 RepID=UPI003C04A3B9
MATKKKAAEPAAAAEVPADTSDTKAKAPSLKIRDLVQKVADATGGKKKGVKEIVEAALTELGEALSRGEELNLPGLGRTRVAKSAEKDGAALLTLKLKRGPHKKREKDGKEALADDGEDS